MMHITDNSSTLLHQLECFHMTSDRGSNYQQVAIMIDENRRFFILISVLVVYSHTV